jgi:phenol 2-monooxygenase (NADPH)
VVRPDQYVANVLPLTATAELGAFFAPLLKPLHTAGQPLTV